MPIRDYNFDTGIETEALPSASTPTAPGDIFVLGQKTTFTIADAQALTNVTSLSFDKTIYRSFILTYHIYRSASGGSTRAQSGTLYGITDGSTWQLDNRYVCVPAADDAGVDFSITSAGQIQYVSDANGGSYSAAASILCYELLQLMAV